MLKSLKKQTHQTHLKLALGARTITTRRLTQLSDLKTKEKKKMMDITANHKGNLGIVRMNREHRYNQLTPNFLTQVKRGVDSMYIDHGVQLIYLTTAKGEHFSHGTDFRTIMHYKANNEDQKLVEYLGSIFEFQASLAKCNKPIMSVAPGNSYNSGATMLAATGIPLITATSNLAFNEVQFGFIPHAGASFYLSRLPGDFGTFLALSGIPISGKDAVKLKLAEGYVDKPVIHESKMEDVIYAMDVSSLLTAAQARDIDDESRGIHEHKQVQDWENYRMSAITATNEARVTELRARQKSYVHDEPYLDPADRVPDVVAEADLQYEQMLRLHSEAKHGLGGIGFYEHQATSHNVFGETFDFAVNYSTDMAVDNAVHTLLKHKQLIDRCFYPNSVEEIMENLRREVDPFAKKVLTQMEANSMISMKVALRMMRKAQNMAYGEVLQMELNAGLNKIQDKDFDAGVSKVLLVPKGQRSDPGFNKDNSEALIESYFQENPQTKQIDLDVVENSLLPTRQFFERFTDSIRVYINESSTPQESVRDAVELEINDLLRTEGINLLDKTVSIPLAREYIYKKIRKERYNNEFIRRSFQLANDSQLRGQYYDKVNAELAKYENDKSLFYDTVNKNVSEIFEAAYLRRLNKIQEKSKEAQSLEKRRMFIRLKKFLITSRLLTFYEEEQNRLTQQILNMPFKMPHLTEGFQENFREQEHPQIQQSVMWHLSKVVGKANLAPIEMIKSYLTDPKRAKEVTTYVFDKDQLKKMQKDLIENPEKYEEMLRQDIAKDPWLKGEDPAMFFEQRDEMMKKLEDTYRFYNDGRSRKDHLDNWAFRTQYYHYKHWAEGIKDKALDSLKFVVSRLLLDFENNQELGNHVSEFEIQQKDQKDGKRASLERIMTLLNDQKEPETQKGSRNLKKNQTRNISDFRRDFEEVIDADQHLSAMLGTQEQSNNNKLIQTFRDEMTSDLLSLLEIVLLERSHDKGNIDIVLLQKRYEDLISHKNSSTTSAKSLAFIDSFLQEKNSRQAIKRAIHLVKPFFLTLANERMEEEAHKLLSGFRFQENRTQALTHHLLIKRKPELIENELLFNLKHRHAHRDYLRDFDIQNPEKSAQFKERQILGELGTTYNDDKAAVTEQEEFLLTNTRQQLKELNSHKEQQYTKQKLIDEEIKMKYSDDVFGKFSSKDQFGEMLKSEEQAEYLFIRQSWQEMEDFVMNHQHECDTLLTNEDWLEVYHKGITQQNLNMDLTIQSTRHPDKYEEDITSQQSQISILNKKYQTQGQNWQKFGEFAGYLYGLFNAQSEANKVSETQENFQKVVDFIAIHDNKSQTNLNRESLFRSPRSGPSSMRSRIISEHAISQQASEMLSLQTEVFNLADQAPMEVQENIRQLLKSDQKYLDLKALKSFLKTSNFQAEFTPSKFVDLQRLMRDVKTGDALQTFMGRYRDSKLDVVSLAQTKVLVKQAKEDLPQAEVLSQVLPVLEHIEDQLKFIDNERRSEISLGDFLAKHHYLNLNNLKTFSTDLLKNQIENALGRSGSDKSPSEQTVHPGSFVSGDSKESVRQKVVDSAFSDKLDSTSYSGGQIQKEVVRAAKRSIILSAEMKEVRNCYENKLLQEYSKSEMNEREVEYIISAYTQARINDCMIKPEFQKGLATPNASIYMRLLRESIIDELKLVDSTPLDDLSFINHPHSGDLGSQLHLDPEAKYNLDHLNNENAIGYNKLAERAANLDQNRDIAHENVFDQMMADYFLHKRGEVKQGNKMVRDLEEQFQKKGQKALNPNLLHSAPGYQKPTLGEHYNNQAWDKQDKPELLSNSLPALMELDIALNRQLHDRKSGLSAELRALDDHELTIPEYYEINDVRKPVDLYVQETLRDIMDELFEARCKLEKHMSRSELMAYDQILANYLKQEHLMPKLKREIYKDFNMFDQAGQMARNVKDNKRSQEKQAFKTRSGQEEFNKDVLNEDAYFKFLAYTGNLEKNRRENREATLNDPEMYAGYEGFEQIYMTHLLEDAKIEPRVIDKEALKPKNIQVKAEYKNEKARQEQYFEDHKLYKEGKLEQHERTELYFVLEQLQKQHAEQSDDQKLNQAGEHLKDYFSKPENTFFYERSKIL